MIFTNYNKISSPVDYDEMWRTLVLYLPTKFIDLRDRDYQSISIDDFLKLAWRAGDGFPKWVSEKMDCDNIAVIFMGAVYSYWAKKFKGNRGLAFGYVEAMLPGFDMPHAFIWHYHKGKVTFVEPQTFTVIDKIPTSVHIIEG